MEAIPFLEAPRECAEYLNRNAEKCSAMIGNLGRFGPLAQEGQPFSGNFMGIRDPLTKRIVGVFYLAQVGRLFVQTEPLQECAETVLRNCHAPTILGLLGDYDSSRMVYERLLATGRWNSSSTAEKDSLYVWNSAVVGPVEEDGVTVTRALCPDDFERFYPARVSYFEELGHSYYLSKEERSGLVVINR